MDYNNGHMRAMESQGLTMYSQTDNGVVISHGAVLLFRLLGWIGV
jgi:hypothetical protein